MTDLSKDEVIAMAREAGFGTNATRIWLAEITQLVAITRAPLVTENAALTKAHEINVGTSNAMQAEIDALKAHLRGMGIYNELSKGVEPVAWYSHSLGDFVMPEQYDGEAGFVPLYTTPQPSAVKVVREMVEALGIIVDVTILAKDNSCELDFLTEVEQINAAIAAGQQYLETGGKESNHDSE